MLALKILFQLMSYICIQELAPPPAPPPPEPTPRPTASAPRRALPSAAGLERIGCLQPMSQDAPPVLLGRMVMGHPRRAPLAQKVYKLVQEEATAL